MYAEDDLLPISALQHLMFCERQCALIHVEQAWEENRLTAEGRALHERVDAGGAESRGDVRIAFGVRLRSLRLGLIGRADVVEFHKTEKFWMPFPVEYKRGKPKIDSCDKVQLCAQAICLEEMLNMAIPEGALFYGAARRREDVSFDQSLRNLTESTSEKLHCLVNRGITPPAVYEKKCESCSLFSICLPKTAGRHKSASEYLSRMLNT